MRDTEYGLLTATREDGMEDLMATIENLMTGHDPYPFRVQYTEDKKAAAIFVKCHNDEDFKSCQRSNLIVDGVLALAPKHEEPDSVDRADKYYSGKLGY